jgi:hypothetical protein
VALRELLATFGVQVDDAPLKRFEGGLDSAISKVKTFGASLAAVFAAHEIGEFLRGQIDLGSQINDTAERLGVATDELQKFQFAAKLNGVGSEEAAHSLGFLNKAIGEAATGNKTFADTFAGVGVAVKETDGSTRPVLDVLGDLADHFENLNDPAKATALAMQVFGRSGAALLPTLNQGSAGLRAMFKEAEELGGVLSADLIANADKAGDQLDKMNFAAQGLKNQIMVAVLPVLTEWTFKITGWISAASKMIGQTNAVEVGLYVLAAAAGVAAAAWAILNIEVFAIIAVFLAIFLIVEDLYTLFTGGDSVIGDFLDSLFGVGSAERMVKAVTDAFNDTMAVIDELTPIVDVLIDAFTLMGAIVAAAFGDTNLDGLMIFIFLLRATVAQVQTVISVIKFAVGVVGSIMSALGRNPIIAKALEQTFGEGAGAALAQTGQKLEAAAKAPPATINGQRNPLSVQHTQQTEIRVYETSNPKETKTAVKEALDESNTDYQKALQGVLAGEPE